WQWALNEFKGDKESDEYKKTMKGLEEAKATYYAAQDAAVFGEKPEKLVATAAKGDFQSDIQTAQYGGLLAMSSLMLTARGPVVKDPDADLLAHELPALIAESETTLPGAKEKPATGSMFEAGASMSAPQFFIAGSFLGLALTKAA